ncbi:hypothetical protein GE21DRAFT_8268 [Neurospora crassa]|uniref:Uncharacterized protein n=2 Tax=Neurospora crassa TaxID=5141 RepID=Q1K792_NEUCR|nr:hypothetical protein NCU04276 [Neurospora crassa OR74A]EAA31830.1 hypothetical protein NCU04276 [Neurospora crassa OR74A]KHE86128.1 hypothetical protein GE21DRAFT_8268 [Neurospora crassa]OSN12604.1 hypothetical protein BV341_05711 [Pseudomonas syringae pv. actinidiae]CAC28735.1 putative protein [Neurospora crassa]|eukprot:XP_961066.1 hypothetical protein NCU04276 [Neurospora crassa OR74A]
MVSPILARSAFRAATQATSRNAAVQGTRQFSVMQTMRQWARRMELHTPYERIPTETGAAGADWGASFKKLAGQAAVYPLVAGTLLGWPLIAKTVLDGRI